MNNKYSVACITIIRDKYKINTDAVRQTVLRLTADSIRDSIRTQKNDSQVPTSFGTFLEVTRFEFCRDLRRQKTSVPGLSCGVVRMTLRLAVSPNCDRHTDTTTAYTALAWRRAVKIQEGQHPLTGQRAPPISGGTQRRLMATWKARFRLHVCCI